MIGKRFTLNQEHLHRLFPFYLLLDEQLNIISWGRSMSKLFDEDLSNSNLATLFRFIRPKLSISMQFDSLVQHQNTIIVLEIIASEIRLRGQFIHDQDQQTIFYACSPWLNNIDELDTMKINLNDFALHDTITDNLQLLRTKQIVNDDLILLNEQLLNQRDQLIKMNEEISQTEAKFKALVESSSECIYRTDRRGNFVYVNPTVEKMTGFGKDELLEKHFSIFLDKKTRLKLIQFYEIQLEQRLHSTYVEFQVKKKDGKKIWFGQSVNLIVADDGEIEFVAVARDITDRKSSEKALIKSEDKYKSIIENLELGLLEVDRNNKIVRAYPKFCDLVGYSEQELIGQDSIDLFLDEEQKSTMLSQIENRKKGKPGVYEIEITKKDQGKVWVIVSGAPYYDLNDDFVGSVGIHLDISDRKQMEQELKESRDLATASLRARESFMANMSHEIRTPLNAIIGMSELLLESQLDAQQKTYLNAIASSSENLITIINDILNFSKIEAKKVQLEMIPGNLHDILNQNINLFQLKADQKGLRLVLEIEGTLAPAYLIDAVRFGEILMNLTGNAIKFTKKGEVKIRCKVQWLDEEFDELKVAVEDTGIGIDYEQQELIFEEFAQANMSINRKYGGTGLGLSISKELVELFGGRLQLHSKLGEGSQFFFSLRLKKMNAIPNQSVREEIDPEFLTGAHILVVDDNELNLLLSQSILEKFCHVTSADSGEKAIELCAENHFDLILMDIRMPLMDGMECTKIIRDDLAYQGVIIALTANIQETEKNRYFASGMNDYLAKPFKQKELLQVLHRNLSEIKHGPVSEEKHQWMNLKLLRSSFPDQEAIQLQMIDLFVNMTEKQIDQFRFNCANSQCTEIRNLAHKLKSSLPYFAHEKLVIFSRKVEFNTQNEAQLLQDATLLADHLQLLLQEIKSTI